MTDEMTGAPTLVGVHPRRTIVTHKSYRSSIRHLIALSTMIALGAACGGSGGSSDPGDTGDNGAVDQETAVQGEALVGVMPGKVGNSAVEAEIATIGTIIDSDANGSFYTVHLHDGLSTSDANTLLTSNDIVYVEPNWMAHTLAGPAPNDTSWANQYQTLVKNEVQTAWSSWSTASALGLANASGTLTLASVVATDSAVVNGVTFTAVAANATSVQFDVGLDDTATAANLAGAINASANAAIAGILTASSSGAVVTVTAVVPGTAGNSLTLVGGTHITASGATLAGGAGNATGWVKASGTVTFASFAAADTVTVNGAVFTGVGNSTTPAAGQFKIGASDAQCASLFAAAVNASADPLVAGIVSAKASGAVVTVSAVTPGTGGNSKTLAISAHGSVSGATLAGGTGGPITIAVVDTGVQATHEDLAHKVLAGFNAIDDSSTVTDADGHGTQVAGVVAAEINNGKGVAGIAAVGNKAGPAVATDLRTVQIVPVKVSDATHVPTHATIAKGINWAVDTRSGGINIILVSLGSGAPSFTLQNAIQNAFSKGVLVIAAAGNNGTSAMKYPAAYQSAKQQVLSVGSVDASDTYSSTSNYGTWVNVAAPGEGVITTDIDQTGGTPDGYYTDGAANDRDAVSGTSFSAAFAAGTAALVWSGNPKLTGDQVRGVLMQSIDPITFPAKRAIKAQGGRLNPQLAMTNAANVAGANDLLQPASLIFDVVSSPVKKTFNGTVILTGPVAATGGQAVALSTSDSSIITVPTSVTVAKGATFATFKATAVSAGTATITATVASHGSVSFDLVVQTPGLSTIKLAKSSVIGGASVQGTLTFNSAAPDDTNVTITSDNHTAVSDLASPVVMKKGATTAKFSLPTNAVAADASNITITATDGVNTKTATLAKVTAPTVLSVTYSKTSTIVWDSPATTGSLTGTVKLSGVASADTTIYLTPSDAAVTVPPTITVLSGAATGTFTVQPEAVPVSTTFSVIASVGPYDSHDNPGKAGSFKVTPGLTNFSASPSSVSGTGTVTGTITLAAVAPTGGAGVSIAIDPAICAGDGVVGADSSPVYFTGSPNTCSKALTVAAGQKTATVSINVRPSTYPVLALITASFLGVDKTAKVTSNAPSISSVVLANGVKNVVVGNSITGTVNLSSAAVTNTTVHLELSSGGETTASLSADNTTFAATADVTVNSGTTSATFYVKGNAAGNDTVKATVPGSTAAAKTVKVPVVTSTMTVALTNAVSGVVTVAGGLQTISGTVTLSAAPSADTLVTLTASTAAVSGGSVTVTHGTTSKSFTLQVPARDTQATGVTVRATLATAEYKDSTDTVTINPTILSVAAATTPALPATLHVGTSATATGGMVVLGAANGSGGAIAITTSLVLASDGVSACPTGAAGGSIALDAGAMTVATSASDTGNTNTFHVTSTNASGTPAVCKVKASATVGGVAVSALSSAVTFANSGLSVSALTGSVSNVLTVVGGFGGTVAGTVSLGANATADTVVTLTASDAAVSGTTVTILSGTSSHAFSMAVPVLTGAASVTGITITGTISSTESAASADTVTVTPTVASVALTGAVSNVVTVMGGYEVVSGTVTLGANVAADTAVVITTSDPAVTGTTVTVLATTNSIPFTLAVPAAASTVTDVTVTATAMGAARSATDTVTVNQSTIAVALTGAVSNVVTVMGGYEVVSGTVTLGANVAADTAVDITTSDAAVTGTTVTVLAGTNSIPFTLAVPAAASTVSGITVTGTTLTTVTADAADTVTVDQSTISSVALTGAVTNVVTVGGGLETVGGTVTLGATVAADTAVVITTSNAAVSGTTVTVLAGTDSIPFTLVVPALAGAQVTGVTVTATTLTTVTLDATDTVTVNPTITSVEPASDPGLSAAGSSTSAGNKVTFSANNSSGSAIAVTIELVETSDHATPCAEGNVDLGTVHVPDGANDSSLETYTITDTNVGSSSTCEIKASVTINGDTVSATSAGITMDP
jgi:subtilisin family serine protease